MRELKFEGNKETTLNKEIALYLGDWKEGEDILNIPDYEGNNGVYYIDKVLYNLSDSSWVFNSEYHWYLEEIILEGDV